MLTIIRGQFDNQLTTILHNLQSVQRSKSLSTKDYVTDILDWEQADTSLQLALVPQLYQIITETAKDAMTSIGMMPSVYDPFAPAIREFITERSTKIAVDVNDETEKQLRASLIEGINAGESAYTIRSRIENVLGIACTMRADLIASTEVARAQTYADISAWNQSGVVEGKEWVTAEDEKVCSFCGPMHGKIIGLDENFFDKGDVQTEHSTGRNGQDVTSVYNHSYDNVPAAPLHPRCRCALLPVRVR